MKVYVARNNPTRLFSNAADMIQVFVVGYYTIHRATVKKDQDGVFHTKVIF